MIDSTLKDFKVNVKMNAKVIWSLFGATLF